MCFETIYKELSNELNSPAGKSSIANRRKRVCKLAEALKNKSSSSPKPPGLKRRDCWFSTTQTDALTSKPIVRVQVMGRNVGKLELIDSTWKFRPAIKYYNKYFKSAQSAPKTLDWSFNNNHAKLLNDYFDAIKNDNDINLDEREIQWQLADELKRSSDKNDAFRDRTIVAWNGYFNEVGVSVTLEGKIGTGNIDLIVRKGRGITTTFQVFEVKKPAHNIYALAKSALRQAIRYAIAMDVEANGDPNLRAAYRTVLGASGNAPLKFSAVIVVPESNDIDDLLKKYQPPANSAIQHVSALTYCIRENKATDWKWHVK